jgi:hypothetical protein
MSVFETVSGYFKSHERLLIVCIAAVVIYLGYVRVTNIIADHDTAQLKQAQVVADAQKAQNVQLAQQVATDAANLKALQDKLESQNAQLVQANATLASALANRQKSDAALPLPELGRRWQQLVPQAGPTAVPNGLHVTQAGALATVQALEQVPVLTEQLKNETTAKQNDDQVITQQSKSISDLNASVAGLNKQIVDNDKVCQDQIKVVKDEARKSKRKWFLIGWVTGFLSRQFISKGL